jgi:hypothetical protein
MRAAAKGSVPMIRIPAVLVAAAAVAFAAMPVPPAHAAKGVCQTTKTHYRTTTEGATTTSTTYVKMPRTRLTFKQGGNKKGCAIVRLSAVPRADYIMAVRAVLDGTKIGTPGEIELEYDSPGYLSPRGFEFVFRGVQPGKHTVWIEWRTYTTPADESRVYERTVTVMHR